MTDHNPAKGCQLIREEDVLFQMDKLCFGEQQEVLGMIAPGESDKEQACFYFLSKASSGGRVAKEDKMSEKYRDAFYKWLTCMPRLSEFIPRANSPEEAELDLSPDKLTRDSFFSIFS
jgi:hypothetical protein